MPAEAGFGGSLAGRMHFVPDVIGRAGSAIGMPAEKPLFTDISIVDRAAGNRDIVQPVELAQRLSDLGADLVDVSNGGNSPAARVHVAALAVTMQMTHPRKPRMDG
jgi:2,4-dienoyl-CoA reductase-like NADH-dependent reductase (Old Yellow Enzyme family)